MPNQIVNNNSSHDRESHKVILTGNNLNSHKNRCKSVYNQQRRSKLETRQYLNHQIQCTEPKNSCFVTQTRLKYVLAHRLMKYNDLLTIKAVERLFTEIYNLQNKHRGTDHPQTKNAQRELIRLSKRLP
jgi:hypothetical protein|tara:strand:- start:4926 stop:5312 length:387 start_codon:yes stop_codon:yes gene_type:complete